MKFIQILLITMAIGFTANSYAETVAILGVPSCGQWVAGRTKDSQHIKGELYKSWLMGYISGLSMELNATILKVDVLKDTDAESLFLWMDNYCKTNPLNTLSDGELELFVELIKRKQ